MSESLLRVLEFSDPDAVGDNDKNAKVTPVVTMTEIPETA